MGATLVIGAIILAICTVIVLLITRSDLKKREELKEKELQLKYRKGKK